MPVVLDPGSEAMKTWLDPSRTTWSKELQSVLKPYEGALECYPVPREVGKVGNNSPDFIVPINSKENKNNIANFFANAKKKPGKADGAKSPKDSEQKVIKDESEKRATQDSEWTEDNAPVPVPGLKREHPPDNADDIKEEEPKKRKTQTKPIGATPRKQTRSATKNVSPPKKGASKPATDGSKQITSFFGQ